MDRAAEERLAERLRHEEAELEEQLRAYERERVDSLKESVHELSSYDNHPADLGNETFERAKDLALLDNLRELRRQVRQALNRLEAGTYGRCARCGREIDPARLEALPHAEECLACRRETEAQDPPRWRPIEEDVLFPPFGRSFRDRGDTNYHDGEDVWQEVARYGTSESPSDLGGADSYGDLYVDRGEPRGTVQRVEGIAAVEPGVIPADLGGAPVKEPRLREESASPARKG